MRRIPTEALAFVAILTVGLVGAGCGSSNNNTKTKTTAPTKAEFLSKGNAICKRGNQQTDQAARQQFDKKKPSQAQVTKFATDTIIPSVQGQINGIKALGAPQGDEAKVNAIVTSAQAALDKVKKDPSLVTSNKSDPFANANKLAKAYGLTACGAGGGGNGPG